MKPLTPPHRASGPKHHRKADDGALRHDIERLGRENELLRQQLAEEVKHTAEQDKQLNEQREKIAELERQLAAHKQNSRNSSKPPSSDGLAGQSRQRGRCKPRSKRKPGGQPGHPGHHRTLVPPEQVRETHVVLPTECSHCGERMPDQLENAKVIGDPQRHQVVEVPTVAAYIIEYQCHRVMCPHCSNSTRAVIPKEVERQTGPRLTALVAYLTVTCRMPRRVLENVLAQVLGTEISLGNTQTCWEEASEAVAAPCLELEQQLSQETVLNIDETGWRTDGAKRYLWAFVAASFVVYTIARTRGSELLIQMLGAVFEGVLCSDRFSGYLKYHKGRAQFCWAHLKRNILGVLDFTKKTATDQFCRDALAQHARLFRLWHKFRGDRIDRSQLILRSIPIQKKLFTLAEENLDSPDRQVRNLAGVLFEHSHRLFLFLEEPGVEPTNNSAERALRTAVQWRKVSFGTRSEAGELATARLLTVTQTCWIQKGNCLQFLFDAISRHRKGLAASSLLTTK